MSEPAPVTAPPSTSAADLLSREEEGASIQSGFRITTENGRTTDPAGVTTTTDTVNVEAAASLTGAETIGDDLSIKYGIGASARFGPGSQELQAAAAAALEYRPNDRTVLFAQGSISASDGFNQEGSFSRVDGELSVGVRMELGGPSATERATDRLEDAQERFQNALQVFEPSERARVGEVIQTLGPGVVPILLEDPGALGTLVPEAEQMLQQSPRLLAQSFLELERAENAALLATTPGAAPSYTQAKAMLTTALETGYTGEGLETLREELPTLNADQLKSRIAELQSEGALTPTEGQVGELYRARTEAFATMYDGTKTVGEVDVRQLVEYNARLDTLQEEVKSYDPQRSLEPPSPEQTTSPERQPSTAVGGDGAATELTPQF